jgi:DNA polymerase-3 subunit alpha
MIEYVSLHNHTSFSIMDALVSPTELFQRCKDLGQRAVAVTDHGTMAGMWDCLKASKKTGVKLIAGCEFYFVDDVTQEEQLRHLVLLAKNAEGYRNLLALIKKGYDNFTVAFKRAIPRIDWKLLEEHSAGLICTTACGNGVLSQLLTKRQFDKAKDQALQLKRIFGDNLAIELQPHALRRRASAYSESVDQSFLNVELTKLSIELDIRAIVATDVHYLDKTDHKAHDVLLADGSGQPLSSGSRLTYNVPEFHVKSAIEVANYFIRLSGIEYWTPEFVQKLFENTVYLAEQCEEPAWIDPKFSNPSGKELPEFPVADQPDYAEFLEVKRRLWDELPEDVAYLRYRCNQGFKDKVPQGRETEYRRQLKEELEVIEFHGFSSYMLIVADYIEFARKNNIMVGPGRGSVGGSLIGYLLDIHIADPIKYKLIFARFHNKEKTSFPDIDTDFAPSGRAKVQDYIRKKYGEDFVAHVSNINTITPKVYARDIARIFEFGDAGRSAAAKIGDEIADSIPADLKSLKEAFEGDGAPLLCEWAVQYPELKEFSEALSGKARAWSTHAGGLIIGKRSLPSIVPVRRDKDGSVALEYDKDRAEDNGLVKMDTLGLETLDIIANTYKLVTERSKTLPPEPFPYHDYDQKTYDLIARGDTFCVFQLASIAAPLCRAVKPKSIEEISYVNALVRPSAKTIVSDFIETREGKKPVQLMHPLLQRAFGDTYGFGLYEECLMYLAQDVAGWDLHSADRLRKLTKEKGKNPEKVKKWRQEFIDDAVNKVKLDKQIATRIWDEVVAGFGGYGFNKSHSTLYSFISFQTAYLKAHYPLEFLVANLMAEVHSNAKMAKENIVRIKNEIRGLGVRIVAPDINHSELAYKIIDDKKLMTGLNALKFMGKDAIPEILAKRPFKSFEDFLTRIDGKKVQARAIQAMAASGCLDSFGLPRKLMFLYGSDYKNKLKVHLKKSEEKRGQFNYPWPEEQEWKPGELFALEEYYMGEGVSGTLNERFNGFFEEDSMDFSKFPKFFSYNNLKPDKPLRTDKQREEFEKKKRYSNTYDLSQTNLPPMRGIISHIFSFKVKKEDSKYLGQEMARMTIQDPFGNELSVVAFPNDWHHIQERVTKELAERKGDKLQEGVAIQFGGSLQFESEHAYSFIINEIYRYQGVPGLPDDLKSRKIKLPRTKKSAKEMDKLTDEEWAQEAENELIDEGVTPIDEESEDMDSFEAYDITGDPTYLANYIKPKV